MVMSKMVGKENMSVKENTEQHERDTLAFLRERLAVVLCSWQNQSGISFAVSCYVPLFYFWATKKNFILVLFTLKECILTSSLEYLILIGRVARSVQLKYPQNSQMWFSPSGDQILYWICTSGRSVLGVVVGVPKSYVQEWKSSLGETYHSATT